MAAFYLLALFISPLAAAIPGYATSPALIMAGVFRIHGLRDLDFETWTELVPATVTILIMTISYSIAKRIVWGIITCTAIKVGIGKFKDVNITMTLLTLVFLLKETYI